MTSKIKTGLCEHCRWGRPVPTRRGPSYLLCERALDDAAWPRYPRLPVLACRGFELRSVPERDPDDAGPAGD